jgi:hypothetical protein
MNNFGEKPMNKLAYFSKKSRRYISTFEMQELSQKQYLTISEEQVSLEYSIIGCTCRPQAFFENESRNKCYFCYHKLFTRVVREIRALQRVSRCNLHFFGGQILFLQQWLQLKCRTLLRRVFEKCAHFFIGFSLKLCICKTFLFTPYFLSDMQWLFHQL